MSQLCLFTYDIPDDAGFPNPSPILRERGARLERSLWVIHEDDIPHDLYVSLCRIADRYPDGSVNIIPFDVKAQAKLLALASRAIAKDIRLTVKKHRESAENIVNGMVTSRNPPAEAYIKCRKKLAPVIKRMGKKLKQFELAANRFGIDSDSLRYGDAIGAMHTLREATLARSKEYLATAAALEKLNPGDLMAQAARNSKVPAWILADYGQDRDVDVSKLRSMFS